MLDGAHATMLMCHAIRHLTHKNVLLIDAAESGQWHIMFLHLLHLFKSTSSGDKKQDVKGVDSTSNSEAASE